MRSGIKKSKSKYWKGKPRIRVCGDDAQHKSDACQTNLLVARFPAPMKLIAIFFATLVFAFCAASGQTPAPETAKPADANQLEALAKKIDEQNAKIDALSQEILKLEQEISHTRPGVMIGETTPPANPAAPAMAPLHSAAAGNTHIVARGETLTSIAKMYKVTIDELQKANHIEDGRKLQAGQTISIPTSATPTPTPAG
jgi:LysM repeat protein